ncbi:hypothetical protein FB45DRAFT_479946 [Roridomyces roridus]|uniref:F-box domain-containing protein n=1 Tax=Roridomyces roridus TaxID=1738132 RepID=A0AAD7BZS6_9AGAR|nr:hypothetical protein FB45DRAFT_479946 [Roridomyces roridus]
MSAQPDPQPAAGTWSGHELPTDMLIAVMSFLSPCDIISLRQVCKTISEATYIRSVWITTLRSLCYQHDIYPSSFSYADMTLQELERAATAPNRFRARLRREFLQNKPVLPVASRIIHRDFQHLRFVPGGRYLLAVSRQFLCMWDLGNRPAPESGGVLHHVALQRIENTTHILSLRVRAFKDEILVILSSVNAPDSFRVHVFTIYPPAPNPEFKQLIPDLVLPMTAADQYPALLCATARHIVIYATPVTILWNFISDSWTSWPAEPNGYNNTFYFCDKNLLVLRVERSEIHLAAIPPLHRRMSPDYLFPPFGPRLEILETTPLHRVNDPAKPLRQCFSGVSLVFHGRETSTEDQPLKIDIVSELDDHRALLTHLALMPTVARTTAKLTYLGERALDFEYELANTVQFEWVGRRDIQSFFVQKNAVHVCLASLSDSEAGAREVSGLLDIPGLPEGELCNDFCSFSGRVCTRMEETEGGQGKKLLILDYLSPN